MCSFLCYKRTSKVSVYKLYITLHYFFVCVLERHALRLENAVFFRRSIKVFGEFFHKGRFIDGRPFTLLAEPLVRYLEMLLEYAEPEDLELFTVQVKFATFQFLVVCMQILVVLKWICNKTTTT